MKVAASSSELGPTRAPRIKAGRLDDDNHDDEERGTQNGKDAFRVFLGSIFLEKHARTFFPPSPFFPLSLSLCLLLSSKRIRSTPSFDPPQFHLYPQMSGKREESKKTAAKTHLPPSHNEFVGCHSTSQYSVNLLRCTPFSLFLASLDEAGPLHGVATALAEFFTTDFSWRTKRKEKRK